MGDAFDAWWFAHAGYVESKDDAAKASWTASRAALKAEVLKELREMHKASVAYATDETEPLEERCNYLAEVSAFAEAISRIEKL